MTGKDRRGDQWNVASIWWLETVSTYSTSDQESLIFSYRLMCCDSGENVDYSADKCNGYNHDFNFIIIPIMLS